MLVDQDIVDKESKLHIEIWVSQKGFCFYSPGS